LRFDNPKILSTMTDTIYTSEIEIQPFIITKMIHFSIRRSVTFDESQMLLDGKIMMWVEMIFVFSSIPKCQTQNADTQLQSREQ
jgi:hypothetical protein